jgi:hypothetical protein
MQEYFGLLPGKNNLLQEVSKETSTFQQTRFNSKWRKEGMGNRGAGERWLEDGAKNFLNGAKPCCQRGSGYGISR